MLTIFGGRVDDLRVLLLEERLPDGWESRVRSRFGLTFAAFNSTVLKVIGGVKDVPPSAPAQTAEAAESSDAAAASQ